MNERYLKLKKAQLKFRRLSALNVNQYTSSKNDLTYLKWSYAWEIMKKEYPFAYIIQHENDKGTYEFADSFGNFFVKVTISNGGDRSGGLYLEESHKEILFLMDGANKALRATDYTYKGKQYNNGRSITVDKDCLAASAFDTNKSQKRTEVKAIARFGIGLYLYHGLDEPAEGDILDSKFIAWDYISGLDLSEKVQLNIFKKISKDSDKYLIMGKTDFDLELLNHDCNKILAVFILAAEKAVGKPDSPEYEKAEMCKKLNHLEKLNKRK